MKHSILLLICILQCLNVTSKPIEMKEFEHSFIEVLKKFIFESENTYYWRDAYFDDSIIGSDGRKEFSNKLLISIMKK